MGQDADQALKQVEQARSALEADLVTLLDRLPPAAQLARTAAAGGGGLVAAGIGAKVLSSRADRRKHERVLERDALIQARAFASAFAHTHAPAPVVPSTPAASVAPATIVEHLDDEDDDGRLGLVVLLLALVAAVAAAVARQRSAGDDDLWVTPEQ